MGCCKLLIFTILLHTTVVLAKPRLEIGGSDLRDVRKNRLFLPVNLNPNYLQEHAGMNHLDAQQRGPKHDYNLNAEEKFLQSLENPKDFQQRFSRKTVDNQIYYPKDEYVSEQEYDNYDYPNDAPSWSN